MAVNRYKRELQVAQSLVNLRWASIPVIFGFSFAFIYTFKMSFTLEPIYILCCVIALFNTYLTLHISMIDCQLSITNGLNTLKRVMMKVVSQFFADIKANGIRGILALPKIMAKIFAVTYLMFLETLKDFPINLFSLHSVMHIQILFDIAVIVALTRFTGSTESPMFFLASIPVAVAGSIINSRAGIVYAVLACCGWLLNSMLIRYGLMDHIKFYSPMFGDLHRCDGWIASFTMVTAVSFGAFAIISHKLTQVFKEKIENLDKSLEESWSSSVTYKHVALAQHNPWVVLDDNYQILNLKTYGSELLDSSMIGKVITESLPDLAKSKFEFVARSVADYHGFKKIDEVKLNFKDNSEHIFDLTISYFKEFDGSNRMMICFHEKTLEVNRKELTDNLRKECSQAQNSIDMLKKENADLHQSMDNLVKISSDKSVEIEVLNTKINDMDLEASGLNDRISGLMNQVALTKADNDTLKAELDNREMILEDIADFMTNCSELDVLVNQIEHRIKDLFGLENSCFHVFDSGDVSKQKNEILDMRKVSPRLLDIPRNHPETLDPALNDGRPVVFSAVIRSEKSSASIAVSNGDLKRMVAFVPVKENEDLLGMMMLEKFGVNENYDTIIDMVSHYLKCIAGAIKNAIENRKVQRMNSELHQDITKIHNKLDSVKTMFFSDYSKDTRPFGGMLFEIGKLIPLRDAMLVRILHDGATSVCSRIDQSKSLEMNVIEERIIDEIKIKHGNKISFKSENGMDDCVAYPIVDRNRLIGVLFLYLNEKLEEQDNATAEFCIRMLSLEFALYVLNEERSMWESFYSCSIPA